MKTNALKKINFLRSILLMSIIALVSAACGDDDGGGEEQPAISITEITPSTARVGESITITGTGFSSTASQNAVSFKGISSAPVDAPVSEATATTLKVIVPQGAVTGPITVKVGAKTVTSTTIFTLDTSLGVPTLVSLNPTNGFPNIEITITGTNFGTDKSLIKVTFGTTEATEVTAVTETTIKVKVPSSLAAGEVDIKVKRGDKESATALKFTVNKIPVAVKNVYWTSASGIYRGAITEKGVDITKLYDETVASGIEIDAVGGYLYWVQVGKVVRAPIGGNGPIETLYEDSQSNDNLAFVFDLAIDPDTKTLVVQGFASTAIQYILKGSMDGQSAAPLTPIYAFEQDYVEANNLKLTISDSKLYWTEKVSKKVVMGDLKGTKAVVLYDESDGLVGPSGVTIDANNNIYVADINFNAGTNNCKIFKGNVNGATLATIVKNDADVRNPQDLEIDLENGYIFWINQIKENNPSNAIMRAKLDGTSVEKLFDGFNSGVNFDIEVGQK